MLKTCLFLRGQKAQNLLHRISWFWRCWPCDYLFRVCWLPVCIANCRPMNPPSRMHKGFRYRLAGEIDSTKVIFASKTESQKNRAEILSEITIHTNNKL